jgi:fumarylpyruvate hydrolase
MDKIKVDTPKVAMAGDGTRFPVRRIFCIGKNYAAHAREMGGDPDREPPFYFSKSPHALVASGSTIAYPPRTGDLHHEVELVAAIGRGGRNIRAGEALDHVIAYTVGIDLTRRDRGTPAGRGTPPRISTRAPC